jgi:hypothetical protein
MEKLPFHNPELLYLMATGAKFAEIPGDLPSGIANPYVHRAAPPRLFFVSAVRTAALAYRHLLSAHKRDMQCLEEGVTSVDTRAESNNRARMRERCQLPSTEGVLGGLRTTAGHGELHTSEKMELERLMGQWAGIIQCH